MGLDQQKRASLLLFILGIFFLLVYGGNLLLGNFSYLVIFLFSYSIYLIYSNWFLRDNKHWKLKPGLVFIATVSVTLISLIVYRYVISIPDGLHTEQIQNDNVTIDYVTIGNEVLQEIKDSLELNTGSTVKVEFDRQTQTYQYLPMPDGLHTEHFENGQLKKEGNSKDGVKEGLWKHYYENGQLKAEVNFSNGVKEGLWKHYYENGQLKFEGNYKNEEIVSQKCWDEAGIEIPCAD